MTGNLPAIFRPFVPVSAVHMLETVIVDPVKKEMHVETVNINCRSVLEARSSSNYRPTEDGTRYHIDIDVRAFPQRHADQRQRSSEEEESKPQSSWKVKWIMGGGDGYIAGKMESWVAKKLLGNVSRGEKYIEGFCRRFRERHLALCDQSAPDTAASVDPTSFGMELGGCTTEGARQQTASTIPTGAKMEESLQQLMAQNTRLARLLWPRAPVNASVKEVDEERLRCCVQQDVGNNVEYLEVSLIRRAVRKISPVTVTVVVGLQSMYLGGQVWRGSLIETRSFACDLKVSTGWW
eukprot:CAMPEP_0196738616 /NCGR_PEP_ID=MMETSP1091-20130531/15904_1 /TAXON_ID=302021 /ORGANISM="Rhodomonas sp., Strain CCMP768" /LENGTH=293 /DNA_ID=CAMNT_0042082593 /DNA_START=299 /DNA_END=1178 /DNA_ORIENTATION=+